MQIVIDIPEEDYRWIKEHKGVTNYQTTQMLYNRVRKSTLLPKGHGRLVEYRDWECGERECDECGHTDQCPKFAPTILEADKE